MISGYTQQEAAGSSTSPLVFGGWVCANTPAPQLLVLRSGTVQIGLNKFKCLCQEAPMLLLVKQLLIRYFCWYIWRSLSSPTDVDTIEWNGSSWSTYSETGFPTHCRYGIGLGSTEAALYHLTQFS